MNHSLMQRLIFTFVLGLSVLPGAAQRIISESEVIERASKNSGALKSSEFAVQQSRNLQKSAFNLPNPEVIAESPSGQFYAVGVLQSVEFPSVYFKQHQLRKQFTKLSEKNREMTQLEVSRLMKSLYVNLQFAEALYAQVKLQDSLYAQISKTADRQFAAGTIDYLAKTFAQTQAGEIHNQLTQIRYDYEAIRNQIKSYTGIADSFKTTPLARSRYVEEPESDFSAVGSNPSLQYYQQLESVNSTTLAVEKNKALPGLVFGYLNQGARDTKTHYRFRVGFTLPLWFWQYSGNIKAAKNAFLASEQDTRAQYQTLTAEMHQAIANVKKYDESLRYYDDNGLRQADDIIKTAGRFFDSGQQDYVSYLRNINEAYLIKARYLETVRNFNQAVITINYLTGKL